MSDRPDPTGLDAAWADLEAALPEGWVVDGVRLLYDDGVPIGQWVARACLPEGAMHSQIPLVADCGPTPAAALRALAARLGGTG